MSITSPFPVETLKSYFAIPLRPDAYQAQVARHLRINFELHSALGITNFRPRPKFFPCNSIRIPPHLVSGHFEGRKRQPDRGFCYHLRLDQAGTDTLQVLTFRNPVSGQPSPTETSPVRSANEPGFFEAEALLGHGKISGPNGAKSVSPVAPKTLVILFDTSLSMQWEKLERSYQALEALLRTLRPADRFNLLLFNNRVQTFQPSPVTAETANIQHALDFVRSSKLRGGTDLQRALQAALQQCSASGVSGAYLVLLSDGGATRGPIQNGKL